MFDPVNQMLRNIHYEVILGDLIETSPTFLGRGFKVGGSLGFTASSHSLGNVSGWASLPLSMGV